MTESTLKQAATKECPQLTLNEAQYLIKKTNEVTTTGHTERNHMSVSINKLISIVNWLEAQEKPDEDG